MLAEAKIKAWRTNPVLFIKDMFDAEPDKWQIEVLEAIANDTRIAIRSGHGVGKTTVLAWAILWFMCTRWPCKIPCTAPSAPQLYDVLWAEVRQWIRRMPAPLPEQFVVLQDRISLAGGAMENFASARTSRKESPDALQGFHSENLMFVVDEAAGVDDVIFEVAAGALSTPGAIQILTGNPTKTTGYFAKCFMPGSGFWTRTVSCLEAKQVSPKYITDMKNTWGEDSDVWRYRVLGLPPVHDSDVFINPELVQSAITRDVVAGARVVWGLDVARYGNDSSALCKRAGRVVTEIKTWNKLDTMALSGRIVAEYNNSQRLDKPLAIYVDTIGIGSGVLDRLLEMELPAIGVNVAENPAMLMNDAYRLRDELWLKTLRWLESNSVKLPNDPRLLTELTQIKRGYSSDGRIRMESKDDMKKRGLRSPDVADALCLTFAYEFVESPSMTASRISDWKVPIARDARGSYV